MLSIISLANTPQYPYIKHIILSKIIYHLKLYLLLKLFIMKTLFSTITLILIATISFAQTAESLKERIQEHYKSINADDMETLLSHHLQEFSIFFGNGSALFESGWQETYENMGATLMLPKTNVIMKHFNAQIYNNVGVALFYLDGNYGEESGLWRVTAVWVWADGVWKEAHHHESKLKN